MTQNKEISENLQNHSSKRINISLSLIQTARNQRRTKALAVYYLLKSTFRNSCIYSYKSRMKDIAQDLGICEKTLYNYFDHLRRLQLVSDHCGNLILTSTKIVKSEARERKKYQITITENEDIKSIEARLMGKLIELHCNKLAFHRAVKRFDKKRFVSRDSDKMNGNVNDNKTSISMRNLQKLLQLSQLKTKNLVKILDELNVIRTTKRNPQVMGWGIPASSLKYSREFPGHFYIDRNQYLFVRFGDYRECLEYPIQVKELSYKQYLNIKKTDTCKK